MKRLIAIRSLVPLAMLLAVGVFALAEDHEHGESSEHHSDEHAEHSEHHEKGDHDHAEHGEHHAHGDKPGWFDPAHCEVCRPMHERPDLMQAMKWESHKVAKGMMMTVSIPADKKADFYAVCESMHSHTPKAGAELCGFCVGFGDLLQSGAKMEEVKTDFGMITLVTSDDAATVTKIHAVADRSNAEMAKMLQMAKTEAAH